MISNLYEVFDEYENAKTDEERKNVLRKNDSPQLKQFLKNAYDPSIQFYVKEFPKEYKEPDTLPGIRFSGLFEDIKRTYMFQKGNPTAESLTPEKRNQLLTILLESFEPREANLLIQMFQKNLKVKNLNKKVVESIFPNLITPL